MIKYGNFSDINDEYDEIWLIVRNLKDKSILNKKNIYWVPELAPSQELYNDAEKWKRSYQWTIEKYKGEYKPRFLKEMESFKAQTKLNILKQTKKNILLVCYCTGMKCHRYLIQEIIEKVSF